VMAAGFVRTRLWAARTFCLGMEHNWTLAKIAKVSHGRTSLK
jgi:hypothetical protein